MVLNYLIWQILDILVGLIVFNVWRDSIITDGGSEKIGAAQKKYIVLLHLAVSGHKWATDVHSIVEHGHNCS